MKEVCSHDHKVEAISVGGVGGQGMYVCPMHPEETKNGPGDCAKDVDEYTDARLRDHRGGLEPIIGHCKRGQLGSCRMKSDRSMLAAGYGALGGFNLRQLCNRLNGAAV